MNAKERLLAQVPADYQRPTCPKCGRTMQWIHVAFVGSRYACVPCEFDMDELDLHPDPPMTPSEASWIIRNGKESA